MQAEGLGDLVPLALALRLGRPLPVRVPEAQREALDDLEAVTLALAQRLDDPQGLLVAQLDGAALAVPEGVGVRGAVALEDREVEPEVLGLAPVEREAAALCCCRLRHGP